MKSKYKENLYKVSSTEPIADFREPGDVGKAIQSVTEAYKRLGFHYSWRGSGKKKPPTFIINGKDIRKKDFTADTLSESKEQ